MPNGDLYDDNTTKAVFYCGRVAVAYTGLAQVEGVDTAEWLARRLAPHEQLQAALEEVATGLGTTMARARQSERRIAVVATGWATYKGLNPKPFICTVSNFLSDTGEWVAQAQDTFSSDLEWLEPGDSHLLRFAGQPLSSAEVAAINAKVRACLKSRTAPFGLAEALGETIRHIADESSERGKRVGKGLIVQALSSTAASAGGDMIVNPLSPDAHSAIYMAQDGSVDRWESPWIACGGGVAVGGGGPIAPGSKGRIMEEAEQGARREPILIGPHETEFNAICPFCLKGSTPVTTRVAGALPLDQKEEWLYCQVERGHLLLVMRSSPTVNTS